MGKKIGIVDLTQGELGTRGSKEKRREEAANASISLGLSVRKNLELKDGFFSNDEASMLKIITEIRRFRNDQGIKTSAKIGANFIGLDSLSEYEAAIRFVCRIDPITGSSSAAIEVGKVKVEFDLTGAIDVVAERARLTKDLATAEKDRTTARVKLENEGFMAKAPIEVVQEIRERLTQTSADIESITAQLAALPAK
jgi:valyl-tRNA synthetase